MGCGGEIVLDGMVEDGSAFLPGLLTTDPGMPHPPPRSRLPPHCEASLLVAGSPQSQRKSHVPPSADHKPHRENQTQSSGSNSLGQRDSQEKYRELGLPRGPTTFSSLSHHPQIQVSPTSCPSSSPNRLHPIPTHVHLCIPLVLEGTFDPAGMGLGRCVVFMAVFAATLGPPDLGVKGGTSLEPELTDLLWA